MKHKFHYTKTRMLIITMFLMVFCLLASFALPHFLFTDSENGVGYSTIFLIYSVFLILILELNFLASRKVWRLVKKGGHTMANIEELREYTGEAMYNTLARYSFEANGKIYKFITPICGSKNNRSLFRKDEPLQIHYDINNPEKHCLENKEIYYYVNGHTDHDRLRKKYDGFNEQILSGNFQRKDLIKVKDGVMVARYIGLVAVLGGVVPYFIFRTLASLNNDVPQVSYWVIFLVFFSFSLLLAYLDFVKFRKGNELLYNRLKTGKFAKAKLTEIESDGIFVKNDQHRLSVSYEFTDDKGAKQTRKTPLIPYRSVYVLLRKGDEIIVCYNPENPQENFWITE